jgi:NAD+ diphosphatase
VGFVEPGEAFEDAMKREETGVRVWDIRYHSGQPWVRKLLGPLSIGSRCIIRVPNQCPQPYPANLMVVFYATADSSKPIHIDLDNEFEGWLIHVPSMPHLGMY